MKMNRHIATVVLPLLLAAQGAVAAPLPSRIVLMWQVTGRDYAADMQQLAGLGVNAIQSFALVKQDPSYVSGYLDAAAKAGLGVIPFIGPSGRGEPSQCDLSPAAHDFVVRYENSPAIAAWEIVDEPKSHGISQDCQLKIHAALKSIDPNHPTMIAMNLTTQSDYDQYFNESAFEILDLHSYVNSAIDRPQRNLVDLFKKNHRGSYPTIVTLRAFNSPGADNWHDVTAADLNSQFDFFIEGNLRGSGVGFYGWELAPNKGIKQVPDLRAGFEQIMRSKMKR